jgi:hypothetical protein
VFRHESRHRGGEGGGEAMTERERFEAAMRLHFKLPDATFDWAEDTPWMTDPANTNGDIIDCDDFWFGWQYALAAALKGEK